MDHEREGRLRFGTFELDLDAGELHRGGTPVDLAAQPLSLLELLVRHPGRLVDRETIRRHLWGSQVHVDFDQGINAAVRQVRRALRDDAANPRFIVTVPKRGYRFEAPVETLEPAVPPASPGPPPPGPESSRVTPPVILQLAMVLAVLLVPALAALAAWVGGDDVPPPSSRHPVRLVVLPFTGPGGADGEWLSAGFSEELILGLSRLRRAEAGTGTPGGVEGGELEVIAATSSRRLKSGGKPLRLAREELGADFAVSGAVRPEGDRLRVSVRLLRLPEREVVWAGSYDRPLDDLLAVQREVGEKIARALRLSLPASGAGPAPPGTEPEAYRAYLRGRQRLLRPGPAAARAALPHLERALELDPTLAPAWTELARALRRSRPPLEVRDRVVAALERALALDDSHAPAHLLLGQVRMYVDLDPDAAEREMLRALELAPSLAAAHHAYAGLLSSRGRHREALERIERTLSLDPLSPMVRSDVGWYLYFARRSEGAAAACRRTLERESGFLWARRGLILSLVAAGDLDGAAAVVEEDLGRGSDAGLHREVAAARAAGRPEVALAAHWRRQLEEAEAAARSGFVSPAVRADLHMALGDGEAALEALEQGFRHRSGWILPFLEVHPLYDPLRGDLRFQSLLQRIAAAGGGAGRRLSGSRRVGPD